MPWPAPVILAGVAPDALGLALFAGHQTNFVITEAGGAERVEGSLGVRLVGEAADCQIAGLHVVGPGYRNHLLAGWQSLRHRSRCASSRPGEATPRQALVGSGSSWTIRLRRPSTRAC